MRQEEHQLVTRMFPTQYHTLKLFAINSPQRLSTLGLLNVYRNDSFGDDDFCHDLLTILRELPLSCQSVQYDSLLHELSKTPSAELSETSWDAVVDEFQYFIRRIRNELETFQLYNNGVLKFNALWLDGDDSLIFFRMEKHDIPANPT